MDPGQQPGSSSSTSLQGENIMLFNDIDKASSAVTSSKEFHLFPLLPAELRLQIWRSCLPKTRLILIHLRENPAIMPELESKNAAAPYSIANQLGRVISGHPYTLSVSRMTVWSLTLQAVSHEARQVYLEFHRMSLPVESQGASGRLLINPDNDIIQVEIPMGGYAREKAKLLLSFLHDARANDPRERGIANLALGSSVWGRCVDIQTLSNLDWNAHVEGNDQEKKDRHNSNIPPGIGAVPHPAAAEGLKAYFLHDLRTFYVYFYVSLEMARHEYLPGEERSSSRLSATVAPEGRSTQTTSLPLPHHRSVPMAPFAYKATDRMSPGHRRVIRQAPGVKAVYEHDPRPIEVDMQTPFRVAADDHQMTDVRKHVFYWRRLMARLGHPDPDSAVRSTVRYLVAARPLGRALEACPSGNVRRATMHAIHASETRWIDSIVEDTNVSPAGSMTGAERKHKRERYRAILDRVRYTSSDPSGGSGVHDVVGAWVFGPTACGEIPDDGPGREFPATPLDELRRMAIDLTVHRPGLLVVDLDG